MTIQEQLRARAKMMQEIVDDPREMPPFVIAVGEADRNIDGAAADRIDTLEAALRNLLNLVEAVEEFGLDGYDLTSVIDARAALGETRPCGNTYAQIGDINFPPEALGEASL